MTYSNQGMSIRARGAGTTAGTGPVWTIQPEGGVLARGIVSGPTHRRQGKGQV